MAVNTKEIEQTPVITPSNSLLSNGMAPTADALSSDPDLSRDLKVFFKGEELPEPTLLNLVISNSGYTAIENAEVVVQLPGVLAWTGKAVAQLGLQNIDPFINTGITTWTRKSTFSNRKSDGNLTEN